MQQRSQRTIERTVSVSGIGFLTGADVTLRFLPASPGHGIAFQRTDRLYAPPIPALVSYTVPRERRMLRALWAGTVLSLVAFLWALYYVARLAADLLGAEYADRATLLLSAFPFALFYNVPYTESLFLLGAVGACSCFLRRRWIASSCFGLLVGLTRPNGCFVSIPLGIIALQQIVQGWRGLKTPPYILWTGSRTPDPGSRIPDPASRIPHPASRIPHPASHIRLNRTRPVARPAPNRRALPRCPPCGSSRLESACWRGVAASSAGRCASTRRLPAPETASPPSSQAGRQTRDDRRTV